MDPAQAADSLCIVVSGLPARGKSTRGKAVAAKLDLPQLDEDAYLERLFRARGVGDAGWRHRLSRASDGLFSRDAERIRAVVLVSHWRPSGYHADSGTPIGWLAVTYSRVVELYCDCPSTSRRAGSSRGSATPDTGTDRDPARKYRNG